MRRLAPLLPASVLLGGCLVHQARVDGPASGGDDEGRLWIGAASWPLPADPAPRHEERGGAPRDIPVSCYLYRRDGADGAILRWEGRVRTPLPWWQRFPCDAVVDLWPQEAVIATEAAITPVPVQARDPADLAAEARAHGYAR